MARTKTPSYSLLFLSLLSLLLLLLAPSATSALSTESRWIVDAAGRRVKLSCVSWVAHLEAVVAEGLSKQPLDAVARRVSSLGFNCVRLTWPIELATNDTLSSTTVRHSFQKLGLQETIAGFQTHNPQIIDLSLIDAFKAVVTSLGNCNVMVILDNHISKPGWCCSDFDGNGFFGDKYFAVDNWVGGLTQMATLFKGVNNVVGLSLRNELRGPKQNINDWYKYMQIGAEAVHTVNPDMLVILSGLSFDTDLSFLSNRQANLTFSGKLVFEVHWYSFSDGKAWESGNPNQVCGMVADNVKRKAGFLLEKGFPLIVSEFGMDQRGTNVNDNRYINCFMALAAELDLDWALWTLVGSYYLREGVIGLNEHYGVVNWDWVEIRNSSLLTKISALQYPLQGPGVSEVKKHKIIFHPLTGLCVVRDRAYQTLRLGPCSSSDGWYYSPQKTLTVKGTYLCIQADKVGERAWLGIICSEADSKWDFITDSKLHFSATTKSGSNVCLDVDSNNVVLTNPCKCLSTNSSCDPASQWFKLVDSTRRPRLESMDETEPQTKPLSQIPCKDFKTKSLATNEDTKISMFGVSRPRTHKIVFHPPTGQCVIRHGWFDPLRLGPCSNSDYWNYSPQKVLRIKGSYFCLQANDVGKNALLGIVCTDINSKWDLIANSKPHLAATNMNGTKVCLDLDSNNIVVTNLCKCVSGVDGSCDPTSQWFEIADRTGTETESVLEISGNSIDSKSLASDEDGNGQ